MNPNIVETINVAREVAWLPWAVQYFFLIGLSYGAYLLSLPGIVFRRPGWTGISRLALLGALVFAGTLVAAHVFGTSTRLAPMGGSLMIFAWLLYGFDALRR